jgi:hypothetical protein
MPVISIAKISATNEYHGTKAANLLVRNHERRWTGTIGDSVTIELSAPSTDIFLNISFHKKRANTITIEGSPDGIIWTRIVNNYPSKPNVLSDIVKLNNKEPLKYIRITGIKSAYKNWFSIDYIQAGTGILEQ